VKLWVDAHHPSAHVEITSTEPIAATASFKLWRAKAKALASIGSSDVLLDRRQPTKQVAPTIVEPDTVLRDFAEGIGWYHPNAKSVAPRRVLPYLPTLRCGPRAAPFAPRDAR
jgi:hypothetical protein